MANYTHEYSNFPNSPISLTNYKDVTDQEAGIINEYIISFITHCKWKVV